MREVKGYLALAEIHGGFFKEVLFGPPESGSDRYYHFPSNNFRTYSDITVARELKRHLSRKYNSSRVSVVHVDMKIGETREDVYDELNKEKNLVVIAFYDYATQLVGPYLDPEDRLPRIADTGCFLQDNGFKPFRSFKGAEYLEREIGRQHASRTTLATFKLRRLAK